MRTAPALAAGLLSLSLYFAATAAPAEIFVGSGNAIEVFADDADGDATPLREIFGPNTELPSVFTLTVDRVHRELWVAGCGTNILVFSIDDENDVPPLRKIEGASTGLVGACGTALDLVHDELFVVDSAGAVRVYPRLAEGDQAPVRTLTGAGTGLSTPAMAFLDLVHDELYVTNTAGGDPRVRVFERLADGDTAPIRTLGAAGSGIGSPRGIVVDLEHDELIVVELGLNAVRFYARTASGADPFLRQILGPATSLDRPFEAVLTENGEILIGNDGDVEESFVGHARTSVNNALPTRYVAGVNTLLDSATGIATDRAANCSEGNSVDGCIFRDSFEAGDVCYWTSESGAPACV
jgi:hypothetical protein